jgi:transcriptional regulator with XRE-family HTH domain|tara:strand:- start:177 stop:374 length:198 start_codon:yes stop_codon:yes gene_type:complete
MTLEQFRKSKNLSHKKLAEFLGIKGVSPESTVFRWINGERVPRRSSMKLIEQKTKGKVKPSSFYA